MTGGNIEEKEEIPRLRRRKKTRMKTRREKSYRRNCDKKKKRVRMYKKTMQCQGAVRREKEYTERIDKKRRNEKKKIGKY